jgi:ectoine hydroxylase-related dioxygenase (phytanoyl-CoA dioxygenase family)
MTTSDLMPMLDSAGDLGNSKLLCERIDAEGYLYFSRLVDPERVLRLKRDILKLFREHFFIEDNYKDEPHWSGGPEPTEAEWMAVYERIAALDSLNDLARSPEIVSEVEALCGEKVRVWDQKLIRVIYPNPEQQEAGGTGAHQDGDPKLGYQAETFYTAWVALMDIDISMGGLAISPQSHKQGILESGGESVVNFQRGKERPYGLDPNTLPWATTDYEAGGAVIFPCRTVHRGLPNRSGRIRLSSDFRYEPESHSANWLARTPGPEVRRVAQAIDATLTSRALYVTANPDPEMISTVRLQMLQERNTTLERAQQLVQEIKESQS